MKYFFLILLLAGLCSCEFLRKVQKQEYSAADLKKEIDSLKKVDSTVTKKNSEYEKTTFVFPANQGDTTIINNYFPGYPAMPRPTVIIQEKGKEQEQTKVFNYEAWFKWKIDSMGATKKQSATTTKGSLLGFWEIFAISVAGIAALLIWFKIGKK